MGGAIYNFALKEQFISKRKEEVKNAESVYMNLFRKTAPMEVFLKKDVSSFDEKEIAQFYDGMKFDSIGNLLLYHYRLQGYAKWCNADAEQFDRFTPDKLKKFISYIDYIGRKEVLDLIKNFQMKTQAFIVLAIFEGIDGEHHAELANLKIDDFNGNSVKLCTDRVLNVSPELVQYAEEADEEKFYCTKTDMRVPLNLYMKTIIKMRDTNHVKVFTENTLPRYITRVIREAFDYLGMNQISAYEIRNFGQLYMAFEESEKLHMPVMDYVTEHKHEIEKRFNCAVNVSKFYKRNKEYIMRKESI